MLSPMPSSVTVTPRSGHDGVVGTGEGKFSMTKGALTGSVPKSDMTASSMPSSVTPPPL